MDGLNDTLKFVSENIAKDIHSSVRRATASLKAQIQSNNQSSFASGTGGPGGPGAPAAAGTGYGNSGTGIGMDSSELRKILLTKVDKSELEAVIDAKSNKTDTDIAMKGLDIIHK